jgi:Tol biopolymer transport system component
MFVVFCGAVMCQQPTLSGSIVFMTSDNPTKRVQVAILPASATAKDLPMILSNFNSWNQFPRLSRDQMTVIFGSGVEFGVNVPPTLTHLFVVPTDGSAVPHRLTKNDMNITEFSCDFSPNDTKLVIEYSLGNRSAEHAEYNTRLATVNRDGSDWTYLMNDITKSYNDYFARWNPVDPNILLFLSDRSGDGSVGIYYYRFDTGMAYEIPNLPPVAGATGNSPTWSSDGQRFFYEAEFSDQSVYMMVATLEGDHQKLFEVNLVNTSSAYGVIEYIQCVNGPARDDDSDYFVCTQSGPKGDSISLISLDGILLRDITPTGPSRIVRWEPDWK